MIRITASKSVKVVIPFKGHFEEVMRRIAKEVASSKNVFTVSEMDHVRIDAHPFDNTSGWVSFSDNYTEKKPNISTSFVVYFPPIKLREIAREFAKTLVSSLEKDWSSEANLFTDGSVVVTFSCNEERNIEIGRAHV